MKIRFGKDNDKAIEELRAKIIQLEARIEVLELKRSPVTPDNLRFGCDVVFKETPISQQ